jgi:hypothetical protein
LPEDGDFLEASVLSLLWKWLYGGSGSDKMILGGSKQSLTPHSSRNRYKSEMVAEN